MYTFSKFFCVGVLNTALDFLVLNILVYFFGTGGNGELFVFFKSVSFLVAVTNSYAWNKWWVFRHETGNGMKEPLIFFIISCVGLGINVLVSYAVFTLLTGRFSPQLAANAGALTGTATVFVWNFIGYRCFVFRPSRQGEI